MSHIIFHHERAMFFEEIQRLGDNHPPPAE